MTAAYRTEWKHWTKQGTFRINAAILGGSWHFILSLNDKQIGTYSYLFSAAESIGRGDHDQELGFPASRLDVPTNPESWNDFW